MCNICTTYVDTYTFIYTYVDMYPTCNVDE